jgi:DeoR/GlpR family transcriptional regulator of sugar metabolism
MSLSFEERKKKILEILSRDEKVQVHVLADELNVSTETIRRDFERLEKEGKLKKVYGGAVKARLDSWEPPFIQRTQINAAEKAAIGKLAASLVEDNDTILLDNGTTTLEMLSYLSEHRNVTIVTHSVQILFRAMEVFPGRVISIGGEVNTLQQSVTGPLAEMMLDQLTVNKAFITVGGVSLDEGLTDYDLGEASISRKMMDRAEETIVLADHSKFGKATFAKIAALSDVFKIVTDHNCPKEWIRNLSNREIEVLIADEEESV